MKNLAFILLFLICSIGSMYGQYSINAWNSSGFPILNSYNDLMNGKTATNQATIQIQNSVGNSDNSTWRITARLTNDYTQGAYSVGAQYSFLKWNNQPNTGGSGALSVSNGLFQLSKFTEVVMYEGQIPISGWGQRTLTLNLTIQGGNHLLTVPNATYTSSYEFKLYKIVSGVPQLVDSVSPGNSAGFQIQYSFNNGQSITLQNGAGTFNLQYANASDYATEKSVQINNALKISSYSQYNLTVKASGNFTSSGSTDTIPISVLKLMVSSSTSNGLQIISPITLSTVDQTVAIRTQTNPQVVHYNLKFYIPANSPGLTVTPGTYSTHVYFVITPN